MVGTVRRLSRFPVKSTAGEELSSAEITRRGVRHDRQWAIYTVDGGIASGKTTRRFRKIDGLMRWQSAIAEDGLLDAVPTISSPDGTVYRADDPAAADALSQAFGQPLALRPESTIAHHDESALHLVTTSSLARLQEIVDAAVDPRRLRANILLSTDGAGFVEDAWIGSELAIGAEVVLRLGPGMPRCVMVDAAQADVPAGIRVLKLLGDHHDLVLGLQAHVVRPGTITVGDVARLLPPATREESA